MEEPAGPRRNRSRKGPGHADLEAARPVIESLYKDYTLSEVAEIMEQRGCPTTIRILKGKLAEWQLGKNCSREDHLVLARLISEHRSHGFPEGSFEVYNKIRRLKNVLRYLKQRHENDEVFFAKAVATPIRIPAYIRCLGFGGQNPPCAYELKHAFKEVDLTVNDAEQDAAASQSFDEAVDGQYSNPASQPDSPRGDGFGDYDLGRASNAEEASSANAHDTAPSMSLNIPQYTTLSPWEMSLRGVPSGLAHENTTDSLNVQVQIDNTPNPAVFAELSKLNSWQILVNAGNDPAQFDDALGHTGDSLSSVFPSRNDFSVAAESSAFPAASRLATEISRMSHEVPELNDQPNGRSIFMSAIMLACMYGASKRNGPQALCLEQAFAAFRRLCASSSPFTLISAITMLGWMMVHVEGSLTDDIMWSTHRIASEVLGKTDPICLLLQWMYLAAANKLNKSPIDSSELRRIWAVFERLEKDFQLHSIVARYCLAFHLLKVDRVAQAEVLAEAIFHLGQLETSATNSLGATDLMTINIVSTLSRAHSRMEDYAAALTAIDRSLHAVPLDETHPLGANHPYMLEMIVRKAVLFYKLGRLAEAEQLYWIAFRGRIATLGPEHRSTNKAHHSLLVVLKERGRWERMKGEIHRLVVDPQVAVTEYESWWRRVVEANQGSGSFRASSEETD